MGMGPWAMPLHFQVFQTQSSLHPSVIEFDVLSAMAQELSLYHVRF